MNIYEEISSFFDEPIAQVKQKCNEGHYRLNRIWKEMNPCTERHRYLWYKHSDAHIYEGAAWHQSQMEKRREIAEMSKGEILCFGAGIGTEGIMAAELGKSVTFYDLDGILFDFLKFRVQIRNLKNVKFISSEIKKTNKNGKIVYENDDFLIYDTIIAIDVLEHLDYPQEMLNFLSNHLKEEGLFLISAPFHSLEYIGHLKEHKNKTITEMMEIANVKKYLNNILLETHSNSLKDKIYNRYYQKKWFKVFLYCLNTYRTIKFNMQFFFRTLK